MDFSGSASGGYPLEWTEIDAPRSTILLVLMGSPEIRTMPLNRFLSQVQQRVEAVGDRAPAYSLVLGSGFSHPLVPTGKQMVQSDIAWWTYAQKNKLCYVADKNKTHAGLEAHARQLWQDVQDSSTTNGQPTFSLDANGLPNLTGDGVSNAYQAGMSGGCAMGLNSADRRRAYFRDACRAIGNSINLAHLYLGGILHAQSTADWKAKRRPFVSTIFTTNFDPLLQRAAQLHNVLYYMTDRPETGVGSPDDTVDHAIHLVYTHGSIHRHYLANSSAEIGNLADANQRQLTEYLQRHGVIVAGYSGWNDTTFKALHDCRQFDGNLFWCGRKPLQEALTSGDLRQEVIDLLSKDNNSRFYVELGNDGADALMQKLHESLVGKRLPIIVRSPLTLLVDDLSQIKWPTEKDHYLSSLKEIAEKQLTVLRGYRDQLAQDQQAPAAVSVPSTPAVPSPVDVGRLMLAALLAYDAGDKPKAIEAWTTVITAKNVPAEQKAKALFNRGVAKGQLTPPDGAGEIADYNAVLAMPDAPAEQKAKALINRGVAKGKLTPPDGAGEIADYNAVLAMPDAPAEQKAKALINRGVAKGKLTPPDRVGAIADYNAVLAMPDAPTEQKATALYNRAVAKGKLTPPDGAGAIADYNAVLAMPDAPAEQKARALFNRACVAAQGGDCDKALEDLGQWAKLAEEATRAELDNDPDFDSIRTDPRFIAFREELPPG